MENNFDGVQPLNMEPVPELKDNVSFESLNSVPIAHRKRKQSCNYRCGKCNMLFASHKLIQNHRVLKHYSHKCQKCSTTFVGRQCFVEHVRKEHPGLPICKVDTAFIDIDKNNQLHSYASFIFKCQRHHVCGCMHYAVSVILSVILSRLQRCWQ